MNPFLRHPFFHLGLSAFICGSIPRLRLFDEIEKAHLRVQDLFLQIFDEGTLTDA